VYVASRYVQCALGGGCESDGDGDGDGDRDILILIYSTVEELMEDEDGILGDNFADHDYDTHGPIDTEDNRLAYPQFFVFPCCENAGTHEGCMTGHHDCEEDETPGKRKRRVESEDEGDTEEGKEDEDGEDEEEDSVDGE